MLDAPTPADDDLRRTDLCTLDVLETAPEPRFDRMTEAARRHSSISIFPAK